MAQIPSLLHPLTIKVGIFFPPKEKLQVSFDNSAGAIPVVLDRIFSEGFLPTGINFT